MAAIIKKATGKPVTLVPKAPQLFYEKSWLDETNGTFP
jgi:hypothetical protein